jgi:hypothetical protein
MALMSIQHLNQIKEQGRLVKTTKTKSMARAEEQKAPLSQPAITTKTASQPCWIDYCLPYLLDLTYRLGEDFNGVVFSSAYLINGSATGNHQYELDRQNFLCQYSQNSWDQWGSELKIVLIYSAII